MRTLSHPVSSAQARTVSSPIRKLALSPATPERGEPAEIPSDARDDMRAPTDADLSVGGSVPEQTGMLSDRMFEALSGDLTAELTLISEEEPDDVLFTNHLLGEEEVD